MGEMTGTKVLFSDNFDQSQLSNQKWKINEAFWGDNGKKNPAFLGNTLIRQELPKAEKIGNVGTARIQLDTWNPVFNDGGSHYGSEAVTKDAWDAQSTGGVAFQARMKFEGTQGGMIAGLFFYEQFTQTPDKVSRLPHNELDFEILTSQLVPKNKSVNKISTNVFTHQTRRDNEGNLVDADFPNSLPPKQIPKFSPNDWHVYRVEWLPNKVRWLIDGKEIRVEKVNLPQANVKQELHMNLWGVPDFWGTSAGDMPPRSPQTGPKLGDPTFQPAKSAAQSKTYMFDVQAVKVEKLSTRLGSAAADSLVGGAANDGIDGGNGGDNLKGMAGDDTIWGGAGNDTILGGVGNDTIDGESGFDYLYGEAGDDQLNGGTGPDKMAGGTGNDAYFVNDAGDRVIEAAGEGVEKVYTTVNYTLAAGQAVEILRADAGTTGLVLTGNELGNTLAGAEGSDSLYGAAGRDRLRGKAGNDLLDGGAGNDILDGGSGSDTLTGGDGADIFAFFSSFASDGNVDTVADFAPGADTVQLDQTWFTGLSLGQLAASQFAIGSATGGGPQIVYSATTGALLFDNNGSAAGGAVQFAQLSPGLALAARDFSVV